jgi:uncharacterized protein (TIGR02996 family)
MKLNTDMINFSFKKFLTEGRAFPIQSDERNYLLGVCQQLAKGDWTEALIYADWLEKKGDPLGNYIQMVHEQRTGRSSGKNWHDDPDRHNKWRNFDALNNRLYDQMIRRPSDAWQLAPGSSAHTEWQYTGPGKKRSPIQVWNLRFSRSAGEGEVRIPWREVPTELLKAGLALYLRINHSFDTPVHRAPRVRKPSQAYLTLSPH